MITPQDIQALMELLRRTPMTGAEALWASAFCERLAELIQSEEEEPTEG